MDSSIFTSLFAFLVLLYKAFCYVWVKNVKIFFEGDVPKCCQGATVLFSTSEVCAAMSTRTVLCPHFSSAPPSTLNAAAPGEKGSMGQDGVGGVQVKEKDVIDSTHPQVCRVWPTPWMSYSSVKRGCVSDGGTVKQEDEEEGGKQTVTRLKVGFWFFLFCSFSL